MTVIRMNTEDVSTAAYQIDWAAGELYLKPSRLRSAAGSLTGVWEGGKASHYAAELRRMADKLQDEVISMQRLASRLRSELAQWENADNFGAAAWSQITVTPILPGTPSTKENTPEEFDWWGWAKDSTGSALGVGTGLVGFGKTLTYAKYQNAGRWINNNLLHNAQGGAVGKMDDLGHLVKKNPFFDSPAFKYSADAFEVVTGVAEDRAEGQSWFSSIGSELLQVGVNKLAGKLITKGVTYLIPGAGQVMLVYEGALLVGRLAGGVAALTGNEALANNIQNTVDAVDLSTYTEKLTDGIFDMVENYKP